MTGAVQQFGRSMNHLRRFFGLFGEIVCTLLLRIMLFLHTLCLHLHLCLMRTNQQKRKY